MTVPSGPAWQAQASRPARPGSAVCRAVLAATTRRTRPGRAASDAQTDGAAPVLDDQGDVGQPDVGDELRQPVDMGLDRVRRPGHGLVGAPESDQVRGHGAQPEPGQSGDDRSVQVGPGGLAVQQQDGLGAGRPLVDVVHAQAVGQRRRSGGRRGIRGGRRSAPRVSRTSLHGAHSAAPLARGGGPGGLGAMSGERCDVAVVGAGLVGLSLAYELACLGATVTVVDAGHPGRATDAGAGILSPATSAETDGRCGRSCARPAPTTRRCWRRLGADGADVTAAGYGRCGILSIGLRAHEDEWFAPFAELVLRRSPGRGGRDHPGGGRALFPPLGPVHRVLHAPGLGPGRRPGHGGRAPAGGGGTRGGVRRGRGARRGGRGAVAGAASTRSRWRARHTWRAARSPWRAAPGRRRGRVVRRTPARRPHEGADRASRRRRRRRALAHRAAAADPLPRALARWAGGLRRDLRGRGRGSPSA